MRALSRFSLVVLGALAANTIAAQTAPAPQVVSMGDLNSIQPRGEGAIGGVFAGPGGWGLIAGTDGERGTEVWSLSGGTARFFRDVRPGPGSSHPSQFTAMENEMVWVADDGVHGPELHCTDSQLEARLLDVQPGAGHPPPQILGSRHGSLWFTTQALENGQKVSKLWAISKTPGMWMTPPPWDLGTFAPDSIQQFSILATRPLRLYFIARAAGVPSPQHNLYRVADNYPAQLVETLDPAGTGEVPPAGSYAAAGSYPYSSDFICYQQVSGPRTLRVAYTRGPFTPLVLQSLVPQAGGGSEPAWLVSNGTDRVCFAGTTAANGRELWTTRWDEGAGVPVTTLLADVVPGTGSSSPSRLAMAQESSCLFFQVNEGGGRDLYFVNAAASPPVAGKVKAAVHASAQWALVSDNEMALALPDSGGTRVWQVDGPSRTGRWTSPVFSALTRLWNPYVENLEWPVLPGIVALGAAGSTGEELYVPDANGLLTAADVSPALNASSSPRGIFSDFGVHYFVGDSQHQKNRLFMVSGGATPSAVAFNFATEFPALKPSSHPADFVEMGDVLLFTAHNGQGRRLYASFEGQADSALGASGIYEPERLMRFGDRVFMLGHASSTATGVKQLFQAQLNGSTVTVTAYGTSAHPATDLVVAAGRLFFVEPADGGTELVRSVLPDFSLGDTLTYYLDTGGAGVSQLTASSGHVYFTGLAEAGGARRLWGTDGTPAGTRTTPAAIEAPRPLGALGDSCVFWALAASSHRVCAWNADTSEDVVITGTGDLADPPEHSRRAGRASGVEVDGRFYFVTQSGKLRATNGTGLQTVFADEAVLFRPDSMAALGDTLILASLSPFQGARLHSFKPSTGLNNLCSFQSQELPCHFAHVAGKLWLMNRNEYYQRGMLYQTDGTFEGTLMHDLPGGRQAATGDMGAFRGHLVLGFDADTDHGPGKGSEPLLLNQPPVIPQPPLITGAMRGQSVAFTYAQIVTAPPTDVDGDLISAVWLEAQEGTLERNGSPVESGTTSITPGNTFVWTPPTNLSGITHALRLTLLDTWSVSHAPVPVRLDTPLDVWTRGHFTEEEIAAGGVTNPDADADGDGVANALEFVFGRHPRTHTSEPACTPTVADAPAGGGRVVRFTFVRAAVLAEGTVLTVQSSPDLAPDSWQPVATKTENNPWGASATVTETALPDGRVQVVVEMPAPGTGLAFMRLSVGL